MQLNRDLSPDKTLAPIPGLSFCLLAFISVSAYPRCISNLEFGLQLDLSSGNLVICGESGLEDQLVTVAPEVMDMPTDNLTYCLDYDLWF